MKLSPWILCSCLAYLFSFIKRTLFRRRRTSDAGLPTKDPGTSLGTRTPVPVPAPGLIPNTSSSLTALPNYANGSQNQSLPFADTSNERSGVDLDWDDWGDGSSMSIKIDPTTPSVIGGHQVNSNHQLASHDQVGVQAEEEEPEVDYFTDMAPSYKKAAKIRKKNQVIPGPAPLTQGLSNRLTLGVDETALLTDDLGTWTEDMDGSGWEEEAGDDLAWEAEQVIREKKMAEREKRAAEQRRKKMEKEAQRSMRKDTGKLATKLK